MSVNEIRAAVGLGPKLLPDGSPDPTGDMTPEAAKAEAEAEAKARRQPELDALGKLNATDHAYPLLALRISTPALPRKRHEIRT